MTWIARRVFRALLGGPSVSPAEVEALRAAVDRAVFLDDRGRELEARALGVLADTTAQAAARCFDERRAGHRLGAHEQAWRAHQAEADRHAGEAAALLDSRGQR